MNDNTTTKEGEAAQTTLPVSTIEEARAALAKSETLPTVTVTTPLTADECRTKILEQFNTFQPHMQAYAEYAERICALSIQYHNARLSDVLNVPIEEYVLLTSLDARETPKSLDTKLAQISQIPGTPIKRIVFDRVKATYHLFI